MLQMSLNLRIFKLAGGLVFLSTAAILLTVWITAIENLRQEVERDMAVGQSVVEQVMASREGLLFTAADVLTADFGFRGALASGDEGTVTSALQNHSQRIDADVMAVLDLNGVTTASSGAVLASGSAFAYPHLVQQTLREGGAIATLQFGERVYQLILLMVEAPHPLAIAVVGFELDRTLMQQLRAMIRMEVSLESTGVSGARLVTSLEEGAGSAKRVEQASRVYELTPWDMDPDTIIAREFVLENNQDSPSRVRVVLSQNLGVWFDSFRQLLFEITFISAIFLALALGLGLVFSRNLTRPLAALAELAKHIATGHYGTKTRVPDGSREIVQLAEALDDMQTNIRSREQKIQYQASHDLLTSLYNRYEITRILDEKLQTGTPFQVVSFKLLRFREMNNAFGYDSGDACIHSLSERVRGLKGDAARLNGSEILWIPERALPPEQLLDIKTALEAPHVIDDIELKLELAVGVLQLPRDAEDTTRLFRHLSIAVEQAEDTPQMLCAYEEGMEQKYLKRLAILRCLERALESNSGELKMFYQPKLDLREEKVGKVEALIRWNSEELGFVPPDLFIPIAEKAGLINQVTTWVIRAVLEDLASWRDQGLAMTVAVNLSVHDVAHPELLQTIRASLQQHRLPAHSLELELTESDLMDDPDKAISHLINLRQAGFGLAIDDFGTGYSSLAYLKNMPVNELKIDKSFVLKLEQDEEDQTIVKTIIDLAKRFQLSVVAEGVETLAALDLLRSWGCEWAQGYYISKPMPGMELPRWLAGFSLEEHMESESK